MTLQKAIAIRSNKLRESARGEDCTFNAPGVCNHNPETTVLAHLPDESHGMSRKSDDISSAYVCSNCHDLIDGRAYRKVMDEMNFYWYLKRAMVRTWRRMIEKGLIKIA